jgi:hypothetical protein
MSFLELRRRAMRIPHRLLHELQRLALRISWLTLDWEGKRKTGIQYFSCEYCSATVEVQDCSG